jgi:hypothetical protein
MDADNIEAGAEELEKTMLKTWIDMVLQQSEPLTQAAQQAADKLPPTDCALELALRCHESAEEAMAS